MNKVIRHIRANAIACLALFVALGGTSLAAFTVPANSVGGRQVIDHSIDAVKLNPGSVAASIQAWVILKWAAPGRLVAQASSSRVRIVTGSIAENIVWPNRQFGRDCMPVVTPRASLGSTRLEGYVTTAFKPTGPSGAFLQLLGFAPAGTASAQAAYVLIVCP